MMCSQWFGPTTPERFHFPGWSCCFWRAYTSVKPFRADRPASRSHFKITPQLVQLAGRLHPQLAILRILRGKAWYVACKLNMAIKMPSSKSDSYLYKTEDRRQVGTMLNASQNTAVLEHRSHGVCRGRLALGLDETPGFTVLHFEDSLRRQR
jgi:hypothetical protein